jgi:sulfatase maturation enzyme AslB (radical SAM superfamily)
MAGVGEVAVLEVVLTAGCNLRCSYCYQNDKKNRRMSWQTLRGALDLLLASRQPFVDVLFLGGEPLLELDLMRRAVDYLRDSPRGGERVSLAIVTNGTLLGEQEIAFLARHRFAVQLSFDGVAAAQGLRGAGTFDLLDALVGRLLEEPWVGENGRLTVTMMLSPATVPHLVDSVDYFLRRGVPQFDIAPVITPDPRWRPERIGELEAAFERVLDSCVAHYRRTGRIPYRLFRRDAGQDVHAPVGDAMCGAPSGHALAVDVDGQVHGCAVFTESYQRFPSPFLAQHVEALRLGDFRAPEFPARLARYPDAARATALFHGKTGKRSSYGACADCRFLATCAICPAAIGHLPGNTDPDRVPDFPCAFNLASLACRERFPARPSALELLSGERRAVGPLRQVQERLLALRRSVQRPGALSAAAARGRRRREGAPRARHR